MNPILIILGAGLFLIGLTGIYLQWSSGQRLGFFTSLFFVIGTIILIIGLTFEEVLNGNGIPSQKSVISSVVLTDLGGGLIG